MKGTVLYGPGDVRFEDRETPKIIEPTDAVIQMAATCVCGSDLWPYRGIQPIEGPTPMGHEYCGIVEEMGRAVQSVKLGQFVIRSFHPRSPSRRPRARAALPAPADRAGAEPEDQPRQGLRFDAAAGAGGRGLPRDG